MRRCSVKPYEGSEKYIFVSYCHRDRAMVFPIIEQLARDGYRVWYDEGIDPGSEWPEIIAKHLNESAVCLAFISMNSLNSHNCRREINFALLKKKYFISVVLETVQMSLGMEMQLSAAQSIFKYMLSSDKEFFSKLYEAKELQKCFGEPNEKIFVSSENDYSEELKDSDRVREPFSDKWFVNGDVSVPEDTAHRASEEEKCRQEEEARRVAEEEKKRREEEARRIAEEEKRRQEEEEARRVEEEEKQRREEEARQVAEEERRRQDEEEKRRREEEAHKEPKDELLSNHMLRREKTNEIIRLKQNQFVLGRSESRADYVIQDNSSVSRVHATIRVMDERCYIEDMESLNKTYLNGLELQPGDHYELHSGDLIRISNEKFSYFKDE